ncbi:MAG TPA: nucleoside hydrolase [Trueperaceae bacterium]|nr:nucleoside hydrolase [Trueperaceae bacterium]
MPIPIWLDCDPGHDDVIAIFLAAQRSELVGISVVSGNAPLAFTERNGLIACEVAGVAAPLHVGAAKPLVRPAEHAEYIHGETGLDGPTIPSITLEAARMPAVRALLDAAEKRDDLWLVAIGPLTNVALALMLEPALATRLKGISIMGGAYGPGNVTAAAEFNIWADPEAAQIVFESGANLVLAGLDVTHQFMMGRGRIAQIRALGTRTAEFSADLLDYFAAAYGRSYGGTPQGPLHDPCSVLAVTDPELFESEPRHVVVECAGEHTRGMTVIDRRTGSRVPEPNARVLTNIDDEAAFQILMDALGASR